MFKFYLKYKIKQLSQKHVREKRFRTYDEIHNVQLFFNMEQLVEVVSFVKQLENDGKVVMAYSYDNKGNSVVTLPTTFHIWKKENLSFFCIPKELSLNEFKSFQADTLIDLTTTPSLIMTYLFFCSHADYRVGFRKGFPHLFDLLLEVDDKQDFSFFSEQLLFYLKRIRKS